RRGAGMAVAATERASVPVAEAAGEGTLDTFPKLLLDHARRRADHPAIREKDFGIWQSWSWADSAREVEALAQGLAAMGFRRGDKLAIIGDNRPRLYWAITAAQCLGGIPVPVYQDAVAAEMEFVLGHAEVRFAVVEDQEQVDKLRGVRGHLSRLEAVHYDDPLLAAYETVQEKGREFAAAHPAFLAEEIAQGKGGDIAILLYTSGTT